MKRKILFIRGGGEGAHEEDKALVDYLRISLSAQYDVLYPKFPGLEDINYRAWKAQIASEFNNLGDGKVIVAHSLGASALLKYLSEVSESPQIDSLFLVAMPYKCSDGEWGTDDFAVDVNFHVSLPPIRIVVMYHSQDDEFVPFSHLSRWSEKIPQAVTRELDGRGHSFTGLKFVELIEDINAFCKYGA